MIGLFTSQIASFRTSSFSETHSSSGVSSNLYLKLPEPSAIIGSGIAASLGGARTCVAE